MSKPHGNIGRKFTKEHCKKISEAKKGKSFRIGYKHTEETKRKISLSNTGEKSSQWKGDNVKYQAIHSWLRSRYGKANKCESKTCTGKSKEYQWALLKGKKYERKRENFCMLCRSCHKKYDFKQSTLEKIKKAHTGKFTSTKKNAILMWLRKEYGVATKCENVNCSGESKNFIWCLKEGKKWEHKRKNFIMQCKKCAYRK